MLDNKLCLGTVQFGLDYGINNPYGKPAKKQVFDILDKALAKSIIYIDTAFAYGIAEELLGEYGIGQIKDIKVISKLKPNLITEYCIHPERIVVEQVELSLKKMGLSILEGYLLHTPGDFYNPGIIKGLQQCKEKGLVKNIGVSIYEMEDALNAVESGLVDYIQVPYSVFDQRVDKTDFLKLAKQNCVKVFARSAFLQGLILMEDQNIPAHLQEVKVYLKEFDKIIVKYGFTRKEAAFLFSYTQPGVDHLVFGVDTIQQLQENIELVEKKNTFAECRLEISNQFRNISKNIIFPSLWRK